MASVTCLGSKVSLISKSEIRYEGILYSVDMAESTLALAKVKSFGTEDRPTDRPVLARDEVYEYIVFRGPDIKDLHVCEAPKTHHALPHDPAIVQHSQPISSYSSYSQPFGNLCNLPQLQHFTSQSAYNQMGPLLSSHYSGSRQPMSQRKHLTSDAGVQVSVGSDNQGRQPLRPQNRDSRQPYQNRRRMSGNRQNMSRGNSRRRPSDTRPVFENDYDFEQANAEFQELENKLMKNKVEEGKDVSDIKTTTYNKDLSFFDEISCEATQRMSGYDWRNERKLNVETFGVSANNAWLRRRRARGGFRRGFRGRGGNTTQQNDAPPAPKTVTFNETPAIKEVEVVTLEEKPEATLPTIEVVVEKDKAQEEWQEQKAQSVWN